MGLSPATEVSLKMKTNKIVQVIKNNKSRLVFIKNKRDVKQGHSSAGTKAL